MKIFAKEKELGLAEKMECSTSSICIKATVAAGEGSEEQNKKLLSSIEKIEGSNFEQLKQTLKRLDVAIAKCKKDKQNSTLAYGSAILVSSVMNLNDDMFVPEELWNARFTPINTPFNQMHESQNIIGHIYGCRLLNAKGEAVDMCPDQEDDDNRMPSNMPDYFDIEVDFVLYSTIYPDIVGDIVVKATNGETFVSMECYLAGFDYALVDAEGSVKIVERNEDTAFLSQFLRVYGGPGQYKDYRIGRVLRGIEFAGVGNVDRPANPASVYTKIGVCDDSFIESLVKPAESKQTEPESIIDVVIDEATMEQINQDIEDLTKQTIETVIDAITKEAYDKAIAENERLKQQLSEMTNKYNETVLALGSKDAEIAGLTIKYEALVVEKGEIQKQLDAKVAELKEIGINDMVGQRLAMLIDAGYDIQNIEEEENKLREMTEEAFNALLADIQSKTDQKSKEDENAEVLAAQVLNTAVEDVKPQIEAASELPLDPTKAGAKAFANIISSIKGRKR